MSKLQDIFGAAPKTVLNKPFMHVQWRVAQDAEDDVASGENVAKMNNVKHNDITGATLGSNKVTLPAGSYYVEYVDGMYEGINNYSAQARIKAGTTEVLRGVGSRHVLTTAVGVGTVVSVGGQFTITESTDISFILYSSLASLDGKLQVGSGDEVFAEARIWKLDSNIETPVVSDPTMTLVRPLFHAQYKLPENTTSGATATGWNTHPLNTVVTNEIIGVSLSSNEVTLPAGTYRIKGVSHARTQFTAASKNVSRSFIRDSSDNTLLAGIPQMFEIDSGTLRLNTHHEVNGTITLTETTTITFDEYISAGAGTDGWGYPSDITGEDEIYSELFIYQLDAVRQIEAISDPNMTLKRPLLHAEEQQASGVGTTALSNGNNDRVLNTVVTNEISGASLSSNLVTLPAGTYYAEAIAPSLRGTGASSRTFVKDSSDNILLSSTVEDGGGSGGTETPVCSGQIVLTETTQIKVVTWTSGAKTGGLTSSIATEVYSVLKVWQLDALSTTPVLVNDKLYPLPGNTMVTGNMHGLEISRTGSHTISVSPGICMDSTNKEVLSISSASSVTIGSTVNELYNLFICKTSGGVVSIQTDTDVNGVNLSAYQYIRWIGFVRNNSAGNLIEFSQSGDRITHHSVSENILATLTETATVYDHSALMPESRIKGIYYGVKAGNTLDEIYLGYGGQAWDILIAKGINPTALNSLWGTDLHRDMLAFDPDNYYFFNDWQQTGTQEVLTVRSVTIKR